MNEMKRLMCLFMHNKARGTREGPMPTADGGGLLFLRDRAERETEWFSVHFVL